MSPGENKIQMIASCSTSYHPLSPIQVEGDLALLTAPVSPRDVIAPLLHSNGTLRIKKVRRRLAMPIARKPVRFDAFFSDSARFQNPRIWYSPGPRGRHAAPSGLRRTSAASCLPTSCCTEVAHSHNTHTHRETHTPHRDTHTHTHTPHNCVPCRCNISWAND